MGDNITFNYNIDLTWSIVKLIRDKVAALVESQSEELAYACKMTSSELVENAVKYGCSIDNKKGIEFSFALSDNQAQIKVANGVINKTDFENVKAHISEIKSADKPQELYIKRLNTLLEKPELNQSQLGLYRIAFEGEFILEYNFDDKTNVLTVTATKKF
jgi:hypothetical protein